MRTQSDERLVDLVRAGNHRAFDAIVHRYSRALLRYCRRFLPAARAEEAVQQAFMNAYRGMCADDRAIELKPWLYRIAHNAALNALRGGAGVDVEPLSEELDGVERPDQAAERRERLADVVAAVQALPPRQRDAIVLRELEGRSYAEIASELQVTGGAVRQLLSRARMTLRAGATAVVPEWALIRLATSGAGDPVAARVADAVAAGGGVAALAKTGTAVFVAGAVVAGAADSPFRVDGGSDRAKPQAAQAARPTSSGGASPAYTAPAGAHVLPIARAGNDSAPDPGSGERRHGGGRRSGGGDDHGGRSGGDDASGVSTDDHAGRGSDSERSSGSGADDDRPSGSDDGTSDSDHSGSGSSGGSASDDSPSDSNSGPGSSDDPPVPASGDPPVPASDDPLPSPLSADSGSESSAPSGSGSSDR